MIKNVSIFQFIVRSTKTMKLRFKYTVQIGHLRALKSLKPSTQFKSNKFSTFFSAFAQSNDTIFESVHVEIKNIFVLQML